MLDIIIVRYPENCIHKAIKGVPAEVENAICQHFKVLKHPASWGMFCLSTGAELKEKCEQLSHLTENHLQLKGLFQPLCTVKSDEKVVLLNAQGFPCYDVYCWRFALAKYAEGYNLCEVYEYIKYWDRASRYPRYDMLYFADLGYEQYFGVWDKSQRVCRFCGKRDEVGSSKSIFGQPKNSHAISYFLGNDHLFCLEECKDCNERFGGTIEKDLSNYYSYYRASEGRKGRNNNPLTAKGFNFEYESGRMDFYFDKFINVLPKPGMPFPKEGLRLGLEQEDPVCLHSIYRLLVKFVIACLPNYLLPAFSKTVKWINEEVKPSRFLLPPVYRNEVLPSVDSPVLCVYIRKDDGKDMPYCVGELRFMSNLYVYAVPYCSERDVNFSEMPKVLDSFVKTCYPGIEFTIQNYCDDELKMVVNHVLIGEGMDVVCKPLDQESAAKGEEWWKKQNEKKTREFGTTDLHSDKE